ncbi:putative selenocysteine-specific elongation factor [Encephalitozoon hellem]|uniref:Selenocysteine-specific elongation factor n=1 Tax=Encephalitozoon hellem TaxID=27973 RepID=A0ABY8CHQ5_ENCHE|nr:putative selenocysteine-specific elongation factor [Encephalitozoon hellem]WEL37977.1 putative selenocysteine-specific elongation factor [Encephalitozoon hellem]WEL38726.1 putative selenocysteine-specific elongation factor [Encephalitozoon hellem]
MMMRVATLHGLVGPLYFADGLYFSLCELMRVRMGGLNEKVRDEGILLFIPDYGYCC